MPGQLQRIEAPNEAEVSAVLTPLQPQLDIGSGPGKRWSGSLKTGVVGIVIDTRGRPIIIPQQDRTATLQQWVEALDEYPQGGS